MNCPNCGAEANESVCPVCGAQLAGTSGFTLAGNETAAYGAEPGAGTPETSAPEMDTMNMSGASQNMGGTPFSMGVSEQGTAGAQPSGMVSPLKIAPDQGTTYGTEPQQNGYAGGMYGAGGYDNMGAQPYQASYVPPKKKSGVGALTGILVAIVAVIAVAVVVIVKLGLFENGQKKSEEVIDKFFAGIEEADMDKVLETLDSDCVGENDAETLSESFELLTSMGIEYSIDYSISSTEKANRATINNMCDELYNGDSSDVSKAYICDVDYTMNMSYLGETESESDTMSLICYKKDGEWYIGGTVEDTESE